LKAMPDPPTCLISTLAGSPCAGLTMCIDEPGLLRDLSDHLEQFWIGLKKMSAFAVP